MKIALVAPHIFMQNKILPNVIFSPGKLAVDLTNELAAKGHDVTLFTPGKVTSLAKNVTADLSLFEKELKARGDTYLELLKKHPLTFISLARQVQSELIAKALEMANKNKFDIVHIYMNEEEIALPFVSLCQKPVVFTHHDPYSFLVKYRSLFPKYKNLNWISMSYAQRLEMPKDTNWVGNVYHGLAKNSFSPIAKPSKDYFLYLGRIIEPKGLHLAIDAIKKHNKNSTNKTRLKIAGKHYSGKKDDYWQSIQPLIDGIEVEYLGFISNEADKNKLLANAKALLIPSIFNEPFGMVMIEALASGTPIIGFKNGAIPEVVEDGKNGWLAGDVDELTKALSRSGKIDRKFCRADFENRFTIDKMANGHIEIYKSLIKELPTAL